MKSPNPKIRILMVDDEIDFLMATSQALNRRGFEVSTAQNGVQALELLAQVNEQVEVAVLDIRMPGIDGEELFRRIHKEQPELPVIMLTGHGSPISAFKTSKDGVFDYLLKPCDINQLVERIHAALHRVDPVTAGSSPQPETGTAETIRLLLIDDELELLESLKSVLERRMMKVHTASTGAEGLDLLSKAVVEVVVLDLKMPGMDGLEVLRAIRKSYPGIPVVLLTGHPTTETAMLGMKQGAFGYVVKPPDIEELTDTIRKACQARFDLAIQQGQRLSEEIRERIPE